MSSSPLLPLDDFLSRFLQHGIKKEGWGHYHVLDTRVSLRRLHAWMKHEGLHYSELNWQKLQGLHRYLHLQGVSTGRCLRAIQHSQRALRFGIERGELPQKLTNLHTFHFQRHSWEMELPATALDFLSRLEATLAPNSVKLHRYSLRVFHTYLGEKKLTYRKLRHEHLVDYVKYLHAKKFYQNGRSQLATRTRVYIKWLSEQRKISRSADELLPSRLIPRAQKNLPKPLDPALDLRLQDLLRQTDDLSYKAILLLRLTGIRVRELRELSFECIEGAKPDQASLRVPPVKLGIERLVPIDSHIVELIEDIQRRSIKNHDGKNPKHLVLLPGGIRPSYDRLREPMTEICARLGTSRWINMHSLRHTYATNLLNAGLSLMALKEILGHKTIIMTLVYAKLAQVKLREDYRDALTRMTENYVPQLLLDSTASSHDAASAEEIFRRLQALLSRQLDQNQDRANQELRSKRLGALLNRLSKLKNETLLWMEENHP